jgi:hypothetical protein
VNFGPSASAIAGTSSRDAAAIRNNRRDMADAPYVCPEAAGRAGY